MRFQGRFEYEIRVEKDIAADQINITAMMLQPFLENSIWHGILPTQQAGELLVHIARKDQGIEIIIDDNGMGVTESMKNKTPNRDGHISKGMDITQGRVNLYQRMTGLNYKLEGPKDRIDADGKVVGARVVIILPVNPGI
jgi:LytS/YehU family sensor histidine kinase